MKNILYALLTCLILLKTSQSSFAQENDVTKTSALRINQFDQQKQQLLFTENLGQVTDSKGIPNNNVLFTAHQNGVKIFLTATGIYYQFEKSGKSKTNKINKETYQFAVTLKDASLSPTVIKEQQSTYTENFYLSHCPKGILGVCTYSKIVMKNIYPGIDWVIYPSAKNHNPLVALEYDFVVHPGADPALIKLKVTDTKGVHINSKGELQIATSLGTVKEDAPVSYCGEKVVPTTFKQLSNGTIVFKISTWDKTKTLIIDPTVSWATYYGGTNGDAGNSVSTDASGNVYMCGRTLSTSGIATGGYQNTFGGGFDGDAMLVKFSSTGSRLWATYFGGSGDEAANSCKTDASGNVYIIGGTTSTSAIALNGFQNTYGGGGGDGYLAKFSSTGSLLWSTYYGGNGSDGGNACTVDALGNVYLAGNTGSSTGIATGGFQNTISGSSSAYLVKFNSSGNRLWGTYYGGGLGSSAISCAADNNSNIILAGVTASNSGIAFNGFQNTLTGTSDAFVVKFNGDGSRQWATYFGGDASESAYSCVTDIQGNIFLAGSTTSTSGVAYNGHQNTFGGNLSDGFLTKLSATGNREWATYYGGSNPDYVFSCASDSYGNVYIGGYTASSDNIAAGGFQNTYTNNADAFLVKFNTSGIRQWGTYYGGSLSDVGNGCTVDATNNIYLTGNTNSTSGISTNGFQNTLAGANDAFLVKIVDDVLPIKLLNFSVLKTGFINTIQWQTSLETTGTKFFIERSENGTNFKVISGSINGKSINGSSYTFDDLNPYLQISYYRLKIIEADGAITYSTIVAVRNSNLNASTVSPNPAKSGIAISNRNEALIGTRAMVTDINSKEIYKFTVSATSFIEVQSWASGVYNIRYSDGSVIRFVKE